MRLSHAITLVALSALLGCGPRGGSATRSPSDAPQTASGSDRPLHADEVQRIGEMIETLQPAFPIGGPPLSDEALDELRVALAKIDFPQPGGDTLKILGVTPGWIQITWGTCYRHEIGFYTSVVAAHPLQRDTAIEVTTHEYGNGQSVDVGARLIPIAGRDDDAR